MLRIQLVKSLIGVSKAHRAVVRGLGLGRLNSIVNLSDTPSIRGMVNKISYLVIVL